MNRKCFIDCETTGLNPGEHEIWDLAVIVRQDGQDTERQWFLKPDLTIADPDALPVGRFYERTAGLLAAGSRKNGPKWADPGKCAAEVARLLDQATFIGSSPWFDAGFLRAFLNRWGECGTWNRHLVDVRERAKGWLIGSGKAAGLPGGTAGLDTMPTRDVFTATGVRLSQFRAHEALEDARIARAVYDATGGTP